MQRINTFDGSGTNAVRALSTTLLADGLAKDAELQQVRLSACSSLSPPRGSVKPLVLFLVQVRAGNGTLSPLFCVPVVVKDNIDLVCLFGRILVLVYVSAG